MSGVVGLALGFAAKFWSNNVLPDIWLWFACAGCVVLAMYRAWGKQYDRAERAAATGHLEVLDSAFADLKRRHEETTTDAARLREELTSVRPRRLTDAQQSLIAGRLIPLITSVKNSRGQGPQITVHWTGAGDCADYAKQLEELFEKIGFRLHRFSAPGIYTEFNHDYHYGIWLRWDSLGEIARGLPPLGAGVRAALLEAGIDTIPFDYEGHRPFEVIVGARRP